MRDAHARTFQPQPVIAGLDPAIHEAVPQERKACIRRCASWMPGSSPGMTNEGSIARSLHERSGMQGRDEGPIQFMLDLLN